MHASYPTGADLLAFLTGHGISGDILAGMALDDAADEGRRDFEQLARRKMLAPAQEETRPFDPPWGTDPACMDLRQDLCSFTSLTYQGDPFTQDYDFWLCPLRAPQEGWPWEWIEFRRVFLGPPQAMLRKSILVTGRWGYGTALSSDVWRAMLSRGAWTLAPEIQHQITRGRLNLSQGGTSVEFGQNAMGYLVDGWEKRFREVVALKQRFSL